MLLGAVLLCGCKQERLLQDLDQNQANEIVAVLHRHNIEVRKSGGGKEGYGIDVGRADFAAAADILKEFDLPSARPVQIADIFPADALVASPRAEKARLYSGIEQRLEQSLRAFVGVVTARVHISYDPDAGEGGRKRLPVRMSALASYEGDVDAGSLVNDIKRFLKNSFVEVEYDNISVVLSRRESLQHVSPGAAERTGGRTWKIFAIVAILLTMIIGGAILVRYRERLEMSPGDAPTDGVGKGRRRHA